MKKIISLILALVLMTGMLAACAPSNTDGTEANLQTAPPEMSTQDTEVTEPTDSTEETTEPVDTGDPTEQETTEGTEPTQAETTKPTEKPTEPTQPSTTKPTEPPHTHSYTSTKVAATCTNKGYTLHKCSCGSSYTSDETAALGHSWGNWTVVTQPTTQQEGKQTRTCSRCGATDSQSIPKVEAPALEWSDLDLNKAAAVGNQYAASKYGCIPDTSLDINDSYIGYNHPIPLSKGEIVSYVPSLATTYQGAIEFAMKQNVDLFAASKKQTGIANWNIKCWCVVENNQLWLYVLYGGS